MTREDCPRFHHCNAPICPLSPNTGIWYPDEDICPRRDFSQDPLIRAQRKIKARAKDPDTYFTPQMLRAAARTTIRPGISGLNPNHPQHPQEEKWIGKRRVLSDREIEEKRRASVLRFERSGLKAYLDSHPRVGAQKDTGERG